MKVKLNHYIYCNYCLLKRRVNKVYVSKTGVAYVYDIDNMAFSLEEIRAMGVDYLLLPKDSRRP